MFKKKIYFQNIPAEYKFLTLNKILTLNNIIEKRAKKYTLIKYKKRFVPIDIRKNLNYLPDCAEKYYFKIEDIRVSPRFLRTCTLRN
jgi:hypothetical protein